METMGSSWNEEMFENYKIQLNVKKNCLSAWELIELVGMGHFSKGMNHQTLSMGITELFQELILDVLKQVSLCSMSGLLWSGERRKWSRGVVL